MSTVVVTLTDLQYFEKAKRTIIDCRTRGQWKGDIVLITINFEAPKNWLDFYNVTAKKFNHIDTRPLLKQYEKCPLRTINDERHLLKMIQWDKFYVFHEYFKAWKKVIFFDAGLRIFDSIEFIDCIDCKNKIVVPDDAPDYDNDKRFERIIELGTNLEAENKLFNTFSRSILHERYFLNCIWVYDTVLLETITFDELVQAMNEYPICRCNEMTIMNLIFAYRHKVWSPFPEFASNGKRLFGWCEYDRNYGTHNTWRNFCFVKYPVTIDMNCE